MEVLLGGRALNGLGAHQAAKTNQTPNSQDPNIIAIRQRAIRFVAERITVQTDS